MAQGALDRSYRVYFIMDGIITWYEGRGQKLVSQRMKEGVGVIAADKFPDRDQKTNPGDLSRDATVYIRSPWLRAFNKIR
jgi:hypothetical protein